MSSFFDKIKGMVVEVETTPDNQPTQQPSPTVATNPFLDGLAPQQAATVQPHQQTYQPRYNGTVSQENNDKYTKHFNDLMERANLPGPDYFEFMKMNDTLMTIPDVPTRFKAVFSALSVQGVTKDVLLSSANHYVEMINVDSTNFKSALDGKTVNDIEARKSTIAANTTQIEDNNKRISELIAQNETLKNANIALESEIKTEEGNIVQFEQAYRSVCSNMLGRIQSDIESINRYL